MKKKDRTIGWIAKRYEKNALARALMRIVPYGSVIHEYLLVKALSSNYDPVRFEMFVSKFIEGILQSEEKELITFRLWGNEIEIRKVLKLFLQFYQRNPATAGMPTDTYYDHGDETGGEILGENTLTRIFLLLKHRGLLREDPHNDRKYLTGYGKMILHYLQVESEKYS